MSRNGTRGPRYVTNYSPQDILKDILKILQKDSPKWSEADYRRFQDLRENLMLRIVPAPDHTPVPVLKPAQRVRFAPDPRPGPALRRNREEREREINLSNSLRLHAARIDVLAKQTAKEAAANLAALTDPGYVRGPNENVDESFYLPEDSETYNHLIRTDSTTGTSTAARHPLNLPISPGRHSDGPPKDVNTAFYWPGATEYIRDNARNVNKEQHPPTRSGPRGFFRGSPKASRSPRGRRHGATSLPSPLSIVSSAADSFGDTAENAENVEAEDNEEVQKEQPSGGAKAIRYYAAQGNCHAPVEDTPEDDSGIVLEDSILSKDEPDAHDGASAVNAGNGVQARDFVYDTQSQPDPSTGPVDDAPVPASRVKKVPVAPSNLRRSTRPKKSETAPESPTPSADRKRTRDSADDDEATKKKVLTDVDMAKARKS